MNGRTQAPMRDPSEHLTAGCKPCDGTGYVECDKICNADCIHYVYDANGADECDINKRIRCTVCDGDGYYYVADRRWL